MPPSPISAPILLKPQETKILLPPAAPVTANDPTKRQPQVLELAAAPVDVDALKESIESACLLEDSARVPELMTLMGQVTTMRPLGLFGSPS